MVRNTAARPDHIPTPPPRKRKVGRGKFNVSLQFTSHPHPIPIPGLISNVSPLCCRVQARAQGDGITTCRPQPCCRPRRRRLGRVMEMGQAGLPPRWADDDDVLAISVRLTQAAGSSAQHKVYLHQLQSLEYVGRASLARCRRPGTADAAQRRHNHTAPHMLSPAFAPTRSIASRPIFETSCACSSCGPNFDSRMAPTHARNHVQKARISLGRPVRGWPISTCSLEAGLGEAMSRASFGCGCESDLLPSLAWLGYAGRPKGPSPTHSPIHPFPLVTRSTPSSRPPPGC